MLQTWIATDLSAGMHFASPETAFYEIAQRAGGACAAAGHHHRRRHLPRPSPTPWPRRPLCRAFSLPWRATANCRRFWPGCIRATRPPMSARLRSQSSRCWWDCCLRTRVDDLTLIVNFGALTGLRVAASVGDQSLFDPPAQRRLASASDLPADWPARSSCTCCTKWTARPKFSGLPGLRSVFFTISCLTLWIKKPAA